MKKNTRNNQKSGASESKAHKTFVSGSVIHGYVVADTSDPENVTEHNFENMHDAIAFTRA